MKAFEYLDEIIRNSQISPIKTLIRMGVIDPFTMRDIEAVLMANAGYSVLQIAEEFHCHESTIYRALARFRKISISPTEAEDQS